VHEARQKRKAKRHEAESIAHATHQSPRGRRLWEMRRLRTKVGKRGAAVKNFTRTVSRNTPTAGKLRAQSVRIPKVHRETGRFQIATRALTIVGIAPQPRNRARPSSRLSSLPIPNRTYLRKIIDTNGADG
jgi:hypothetical protein